MDKRIHKVVFYTLLLAVYSAFFSVESFYNFEGHLDAKAFFTAPVHFLGDHQQVVKKAPLPSSSSHKIRLNKRFHQENIAPCPMIAVAAPQERIIPIALGAYKTLPLPAVQVAHLRLRGPPSVA